VSVKGRVVGIAVIMTITAALMVFRVANADTPMGVPIPSSSPRGIPIAIDECSLEYSGNLLVGQVAGVLVKFTNETNITADVVQIRVATESGVGGILRDVGKFSPGTEITHTFREGEGTLVFAPLFSHPHISCSIIAVHFVDGSTWQPPSQENIAQATPTPTPICDPHEIAIIGSKASNELDVQDYVHALDDSKSAAALFGGCATGAAGVDRYLFVAGKAYALGIAGNAALGLGQRKSATLYLNTAQRVMNSIPTAAKKYSTVHDEMAKAAASIKQLSRALKPLKQAR